MDDSDLHCAFEIKSEGDNVATFTGIASTSDQDSHHDIIEAGAFDPILTKQTPAGEMIPAVMMLRDHDRTNVIGGWKAFAQNGKNLVVEGQLDLEVTKARETYSLMKKGFLNGLSVGFDVPDRSYISWNDRTGVRHIKKAILRECSIVAFPANRHTNILRVKSEMDTWLKEREIDPEDFALLLSLVREARKSEDKKDLIKGIDGFAPIDTSAAAEKLNGLLLQLKGRFHG